MGDKSNRNSIGGNFEGNFIGGDGGGSNLTYGKQESASLKHQQAEIEASITQLRVAIEAEANLPKDQKEKVLEQVKLIEEAVKNPKEGEKKKQAQDATSALKGMISVLPVAANIVEACNKILPLVTKILGLG